MIQKIQESALEQYKIDILVYKNNKEKLGALNRKIYRLEENFSILFWLFVSILVLPFFYIGNVDRGFAIFILIFFLSGLFLPDFFTNLFTLGKFNKLKKQLEGIEELEKDARSKLELFERTTNDYYQNQLKNFFERNLYKKRSGNPQFEESLSEFSSMIEELSVLSSAFITTKIPLDDYNGYLIKRTINHNFQTSKKSEELVSIRNFVKNFSEPQKEKVRESIPPEKMYRMGRKIDNWEEINRKRKMTGAKGEEIAVAVEKEFFESINRKDLADKVRHVSVEDGDGLGYDILSFFEDGREKYIEVKTTTVSLNSAYFLSSNELKFLQEHREDAFIYRFLISNDIPQVKTYSVSEVLEINEIFPVQYKVQAK